MARLSNENICIRYGDIGGPATVQLWPPYPIMRETYAGNVAVVGLSSTWCGYEPSCELVTLVFEYG